MLKLKKFFFLRRKNFYGIIQIENEKGGGVMYDPKLDDEFAQLCCILAGAVMCYLCGPLTTLTISLAAICVRSLIRRARGKWVGD